MWKTAARCLLEDTTVGDVDGNCNALGAVGIVEIAQDFVPASLTSKLDSNASPTKDDTEVIDAKKRSRETSDFLLNRIPRRPNRHLKVSI